MQRPNIALWSANLAHPLYDLEGWLDWVRSKIDAAAEQGADFLLAPELWSAHWLDFKPTGLAAHEEVAWMAEQAPPVIEALQRHIEQAGIVFVAGSTPWRQDDGRHTNRSWTLLPDGCSVPYDKQVLTPSEQDPQNWSLTTGREIRIIQWKEWRFTTLICLDIEIPALAVALAPHQPDLIFVPSMTEARSGYHRVYSCAKARAVELMTSVVVCGCIGESAGSDYIGPNVSGAAVYIPCEKELGYTGIFAEHASVGAHDGDGLELFARDIPVDIIRAKREGSAEVWPGAMPITPPRIISE